MCTTLWECVKDSCDRDIYKSKLGSFFLPILLSFILTLYVLVVECHILMLDFFGFICVPILILLRFRFVSVRLYYSALKVVALLADGLRSEMSSTARTITQSVIHKCKEKRLIAEVDYDFNTVFSISDL